MLLSIFLMENIFKLVEFAVKGKILLQVSFVFSLSALLHFVLCLVFSVAA